MDEYEKEAIMDLTSFSEGSMPFRYLGCCYPGMESFWLGVLPISAAVLDRITSMCRRFLWGGNLARVAWHTMCLSKLEGRLGLRDTRTWNDAPLSKDLDRDQLVCKIKIQMSIESKLEKQEIKT
ncbi:hypothetical protein M9H77_30987 [Catharanthus roseus]|uniref:Uncharacterized protein n=1 Tax=Catharanthus roseus TaxID=4058 RepID=A0ACB9ZYS4_CATRO|nr:hypothetical protein M9H77_30987 [Catharanthus roseus]